MNGSLLLFASFAIVGILLGSFTSQYVSEDKLKAGFGWLIMIMSIYIIVKELT